MIIENQKRRFQFLHKLFELTGGSELNFCGITKVAKELGFKDDLVNQIIFYLKNEGLIYLEGPGLIRISHEGIMEIEEAIANPDSNTEHFLPINIISIGQMTDSQIQQASPGASQVITFSDDQLDSVKELTKLIKESFKKFNLQQQQLDDLRTDIQTIEAQMSKSKPKAIIITESLKSIRTILESAAGSMLVQTIVNQIATLI